MKYVSDKFERDQITWTKIRIQSHKFEHRKLYSGYFDWSIHVRKLQMWCENKYFGHKFYIWRGNIGNTGWGTTDFWFDDEKIAVEFCLRFK